MLYEFLSAALNKETFALFVLVACVLYWFKRSKERQCSSHFKVFVPLNDSMANFRSSVIAQDVYFFLCLSLFDSKRFAADIKIKFLLKETTLDLKYLFMDFYNIAHFSQCVLNGHKHTPKIIHGRIYLDKKFLNLSDFNVFEFSYSADRSIIPIFEDQRDLFIINGNLRHLASFFPCFDQPNFVFHITMNVKSNYFGTILYFSPIIKERRDSDLLYVNYDTNKAIISSFFLLAVRQQTSFKRHNIRLERQNNLDFFVYQSFFASDSFIQKILKFTTTLFKLAIKYFSGLLKQEIKELSIEITLVGCEGQISGFNSKNIVVLFKGPETNSVEFKNELVFRFVNSFVEIITKEESNSFLEGGANFIAKQVQLSQKMTDLISDFLVQSESEENSKVILYFMFQQNSFFNSKSLLKQEEADFLKYKTNFQVYQYFNFEHQKEFGRALIRKALSSPKHKTIMSYVIKHNGKAAAFRRLLPAEPTDKITLENIFMFDEFEPKTGFIELVTPLLYFLKFQNKQECVYFLHYFCHFMAFQPNSIELLSRIFKNNSEVVKSKKICRLAADAILAFVSLPSDAQNFELIIARLVDSLQGKGFLPDKGVSALLVQALKNFQAKQPSVFERQTKRFLKQSYSFQDYYFLKNLLDRRSDVD